MNQTAHLPNDALIATLAGRTPENPVRVLVSGCLAGHLCGIDGTSYGNADWIRDILALPNVKATAFCPEDFVLGTPRGMPDIHGGDGFDVLDGRARILSEHGEDWTEKMVRAAGEMARLARAQRIELAILMDMSAACGSQVISDGCRLKDDRRYRRGPGVAAAKLTREGVAVVSQRDYRTLGKIRAALDPGYVPDANARDHHETQWYRDYFAS